MRGGIWKYCMLADRRTSVQRTKQTCTRPKLVTTRVSLVRVREHHANGRPRPLCVCAPRPPAASWLGVVSGGEQSRASGAALMGGASRTVARLRSRAHGGCFYMNSLLLELLVCLEVTRHDTAPRTCTLSVLYSAPSRAATRWCEVVQCDVPPSPDAHTRALHRHRTTHAHGVYVTYYVQVSL